MLGLSWGEIALIGTVALVVLGPERLPVVARTSGRWLARVRAFVQNVKSELSEQVNLADLRELQQGFAHTAATVRTEFHSNLSQVQAQTHAWRDEVTRLPDERPIVSTPNLALDGATRFQAASAGFTREFAPRSLNSRALQARRARHVYAKAYAHRGRAYVKSRS